MCKKIMLGEKLREEDANDKVEINLRT